MTPPHDSYWAIPGNVLAGPYPGAVDETTARLQVEAFLAAAVTCFVDLTEESELEPYAQLLTGTTARHVRHPIRDLDVPTLDEMRSALATIREAVAAGETVYVHCWGGVGRTGTVVGCLLVEGGATPAEALDALPSLRSACVRRHRPSPETSTQRRFVERWAASDDGSPSRPPE